MNDMQNLAVDLLYQGLALFLMTVMFAAINPIYHWINKRQITRMGVAVMLYIGSLLMVVGGLGLVVTSFMAAWQ